MIINDKWISGDRARLQIYLNDHRAGAVGGLALARRLAENNDGNELGRTAAEISDEIEEDAHSLDRVIDALELHQNPAKRMAAAVMERVGRLKPNGQVLGYSALSRLLEIEALMTGIAAKRSLWCSLLAASDGPSVGDVDLQELIDRADSQRERLVPHHGAAAASALAEPLRG